MSTDQQSALCQPAVTTVGQELWPFMKLATHHLNHPPHLFKANLSPSTLALLAAIYKESSLSKVIIKTGPMKELPAFLDELQAWDNFLGINHRWHLIEGTLSEQEENGDIITELSSTMHRLLSPARNISDHYVIPATLLDSELPNPNKYKNMCLTLTLNERISLKDLIRTFVANGFTRHANTIDPGTIRIRGEQLDISHPILPGNYTLTFFGNVIESITHHLGRRSQNVNQVMLPPMIFPKEKCSIQKVFSNSLLFTPVEYDEYTGQQTIIHNSITPDEQFPFSPIKKANEKLPLSMYYAVYTNQDRVQNYFADRDIGQANLCPHPLADFPIGLVGAQTGFVTERFLFPQTPGQQISPISRERAQELIGQLAAGMPAVHADHGIGIYEGLQLRNIDGIEREYLILRYAEGDALSVPIEFAHKVTAYNGESAPKVNKLGGGSWQKTKKKAKYDAEIFAKELLEVAANRAKNTRPPYRVSPDLEERLHRDFIFTLTQDQERTWQEVLSDLKSEQPMDRLIVGDVGFGKTEIAVRATAHAVNNGKQVAILAPTTLLVQQHFDTFKQRLPHMNNIIGLLSRLSSPTEQASVRTRIKEGELSVVIGTSALLSKSTSWHNLGLIIIDEEQRFGVKQKEHFKKIRSVIDTLSLSATPIPRTLSMALSGLRQLSVISTPPKGRKDIKTIVKRDSDTVMAQALKQELARQGQAYLVAPTIRQLPSLQERVKSLVPGVRTAIAHGQLSANELSRIMSRFDRGEIDVLVSSSIVENGLDLPNANTLIVCRATNFGLAELYQLRGRVGRRQRQGHAYFLYDRDNLSPVQKQRLAALTESARLGSGWSLAQRDLEIRGAGNMLGAEQSGSVTAVGVQLYLDMVHQAMEGNADQFNPVNNVEVNLPLPAILPVHYIADSQERTRWYQKLTRAKTVADLDEQLKNLEKSYGKYPPETHNLLLLLTLQRVAGRIGITRVGSSQVTPPDENPYDRLEITTENIPQALQALGVLGNWVVRRDGKMTWDVDAITPALVQKIIDAVA